MKTTFFIATAIFLSSIASAQQTDIRSKSSSSATVAGSPSGAATKGSIQNTTEVKGEADPKPAYKSGVAVAGKAGSELHSQSTSAGNTAKTDASNVINKEVSAIELENKKASTVAVSSGKDNKIGAGTSLKTSNSVSTNVSATEPIVIKKSGKSAVNQSVETSSNVVAGTDNFVHAKSGSAISLSQSASKNVQATAKKSARVKTNTDASVNTQIRPIPVKTSSMMRTGANLGL